MGATSCELLQKAFSGGIRPEIPDTKSMPLEIRAGASENPEDRPSVCKVLKSHGSKNIKFG